MRTRAVRVGDPSEAPNGIDGSSAKNPLGVILPALRRQWPLLSLAVIVSGAAAYFVATEYGVVVATAHLTLSSQSLPMSGEKVYTTPSPNVAAATLKSVAVLQPVIDEHGLPAINQLMEYLKVTPNLTSSSISVDLELEDSRKAVLALNDIGEEFAKAITQNRKETLAKHANYVSELLVKATSDLGTARTELIKLQDSLRMNGDNDVQKSAALQGLINRQTQLESSLEQTKRQRTRIERDQQLLAEETTMVLHAAYRDVLDGRQRQAGNIAQGLTNSARKTTVRKEIQEQLTALEAELLELYGKAAPLAESPVDAGADDSTEAVALATGASAVAASLASAGAKPDASTTDTPENLTDAGAGIPELSEDPLMAWIKKVSAVGKDVLGDLEPATVAATQLAQAKLSTISDNSRRLQFEALDNKVDQGYYEAKEKELETAMKLATTAQVNLTSTRLMELESDVSREELKYSRLQQQLDQINQIKDCQMSEYIISSPARVNNLIDYKSDKKKTFVFVLLGSGLLLVTPSVVMELLRLRPTPVNVVSRRWNLPVLGMQTANLPAKAGQKERGLMSQHELRLMALRIQQSLCRPEGRVVLFAGLDHEESPMGLIRPLAKCFSQREESVLMIQAMPCQLEIQAQKDQHKHGQKPQRPGVAEFLAGEFEDASQLVVGTGITGIDFLPGGCTVTASEAMASSRLTTLIDQFRERYSMILLCGPSTLHPADLQMLAARADGIVLTVNKRSLQTVYGEEVINDLIELGAPILGFAEQPLMAKKSFPTDKDVFRETPATAVISA